jgi:hypothetical protein
MQASQPGMPAAAFIFSQFLIFGPWAPCYGLSNRESALCRALVFWGDSMRLWFLSLGIVLVFGVCGYMLVQYAESHVDGRARWLGATPSVEFVKSIVTGLQSKDFAAIEAKSDRSIINEQSRPAFAQINSLLTSSPPKSIRLASWWSTRSLAGASTAWHTVLSLEYEIDGKWFLVNARVRSNEGEPLILEGINLQPIPAPLETVNRPSLQGMRGVHYFFLALWITIGTYTIAAVITCLRRKMPVWRKILWLVGIFSGVGTFSLNWTSGSPHFQLLFIHIPTVGFGRVGLLGPYIFWCTVPVFAILFLFLHLSPPRQIETDADRTLPSGS